MSRRSQRRTGGVSRTQGNKLVGVLGEKLAGGLNGRREGELVGGLMGRSYKELVGGISGWTQGLELGRVSRS